MPDTIVAETVRNFLGEAEAGRARKLVRGCVRCGMCTAVCPTYALTGDELDGPRGRIHLVRDILQSGAASPAAVRHLDRCLGCRACETACPSGVQYGELADIGRHFVLQNDSNVRPLSARLSRAVVAGFFSNPALVKTAALLARMSAPLLPAGLRNTIAPNILKGGARKMDSFESETDSETETESKTKTHPRKIIALPGCVEGAFAPGGFAALKKIAAAAEVEVVSPKGARCCGALRLHLGMRNEALADIAQTRNAWRSAADDNAEAIVSPSSGCEAVLREHSKLSDSASASDSNIGSDSDSNSNSDSASPCAFPPVLNPAEFVAAEWQSIAPKLRPLNEKVRVAFHAPCTLRNAMRMENAPAEILSRAGYEITPIADAHMCCGSAGTYSLLQPKMARELRRRKVRNLQAANADRVATANVGCQMFLSAKTPVVHWLELLAERLE